MGEIENKYTILGPNLQVSRYVVDYDQKEISYYNFLK